MIDTRAWAERARSFGETIFSEINTLAQRHDALNLGQGAPDFAPPEFVIVIVWPTQGSLGATSPKFRLRGETVLAGLTTHAPPASG